MAIDLDRTARFIAGFEGFVDHVYRDPVGVETWGYGETDNRYRPANGRISEPEAFALLKKRVQQFADAVEGCVDRRMSPNQHGALTSLAYNIGVGGFCKSTVARLFNQGDIEGAARAFLMWNKAGGRILPGLDRRRRAEMALFLSDDPGEPPPPPEPERPKPRRPTMFLAADPRDGKTYLFDGNTKRHVANWATVTDKMMPAGVPQFGVLDGEERLIDSYETK